MIKRTLYFGNPTYLRIDKSQLVVDLKSEDEIRTFPVEDIGMIVLDHPRITITHGVMRAVQANKGIIVSCDESHLPHSIFLPLHGHSIQTKRQAHQLNCSEPLRKQLWQQTIQAKVRNQKSVLVDLDINVKRLEVLEKRVQSGDATNVEGQAAAFYWRHYMPETNREQFGDPPNNYLNYGYSILRSIVARALVSSGLLPSVGIHHSNQYNPFCLADDVMEPYRPFVDRLVLDVYDSDNPQLILTKEVKQALLSIPVIDVMMKNKRSPLMVAVSQTTASLADCFAGTKRKIKYPTMT